MPPRLTTHRLAAETGRRKAEAAFGVAARRGYRRAWQIVQAQLPMTKLQKAGPGLGDINDPMVLGNISGIIEDELQKGATDAAGILSDAQNGWFKANGLKFSPTESKDLLTRYTSAFHGDVPGGFRGVASTVTDEVHTQLVDYYANEAMTRADLLDALAPTFSPIKAETVATTETTRMSAQATLMSAETTGTEQWEWDNANDDVVCDECTELGGQVFAFSDQAELPPAHVNCRCGMGLLLSGDMPMAGAEEPALDLSTPDLGAGADWVPGEEEAANAAMEQMQVEEAAAQAQAQTELGQLDSGSFASTKEGVQAEESALTDLLQAGVSDAEDPSAEELGAIKEGIAKDIAARLEGNPAWEDYVATTGVPSGQATSDLVERWAVTSGDTQASSIALQMATDQEFNLNAATEHYFADAEAKVMEDVNRLMQTEGDAYKAFARAMYDNTQAWLSENGIDSMQVFRGAGIDMLPEGVVLDANGAVFTQLDTQLSPMSSFSVNRDLAYTFARGEGMAGGGELVGPQTDLRVVMATRVPADRIISVCRTGYGCVYETEVVVLGSPVDTVAAQIFDIGPGAGGFKNIVEYLIALEPEAATEEEVAARAVRDAAFAEAQTEYDAKIAEVTTERKDYLEADYARRQEIEDPAKKTRDEALARVNEMPDGEARAAARQQAFNDYYDAIEPVKALIEESNLKQEEYQRVIKDAEKRLQAAREAALARYKTIVGAP